ncbi:MAG: polysaccharide lyase family 7 protein [Prolixibacteraceae bacterium]
MRKLFFYRLVLVIVVPLAFFSVAIAQDPNLPPSGNFDLINWKITLPDQSEIKETDLADGFESANEFYTDTITGAMVFRCPNDGATGGSSYPRCELREMLRAGNTLYSTKGIGKNNWVFSSSSEDNQQKAGGIDGTLRATVAVDHVSTTGESGKVGRVIIGQIHASDDEPCRLYYHKLPGNTKGSIYFAHEPITGSEQWHEMIGTKSSSASDPEDGIALGEKFSYEINVTGNFLSVSIMRPGKPDVQKTIDMSASGFANDWMYFKAGVYNQNNTGDSGDYCQVSFFALNKTHSDSINLAPTISITTPANDTTIGSGENLTIVASALDSNDSISKVEFFQGTKKLGEATSSPYNYTWNNVPEGSYMLSATATDSRGLSSTSSTVNLDVFDSSNNYGAPYEIPRFQPFMDECKLQAPTSTTVATSDKLKEGYTSDWFYVAEGDKVAFNQSGDSKRTELRHQDDWDLNNADRSFHGRLKFVKQTCDEVTVIQIHDDANVDNGPNKPLLRIYKHLTKAPENHLWAAIKTDAGGDNTRHFDLGEAPAGYFDWNVILEDGELIISINAEEKARLDVSFWTFRSYWKTGVYLQDDGEATVYFDELYLGEVSKVSKSDLDILYDIRVYPNPSASFVTINFGNTNFLDGTITLLDITGKIHQKVKIKGEKMVLQLVVNPGLYVLKIEKGDYIKTSQLVKI